MQWPRQTGADRMHFDKFLKREGNRLFGVNSRIRQALIESQESTANEGDW